MNKDQTTEFNNNSLKMGNIVVQNIRRNEPTGHRNKNVVCATVTESQTRKMYNIILENCTG
jgi:hypothetical protein